MKNIKKFETREIGSANHPNNIGAGERFASAATGGALVYDGIKRGGTAGMIESAAGILMLLRGTTGHSYLYDVLGIDAPRKRGDASPYGRKSFFQGKIHVSKAVTINKSTQELYTFWRNFENLPMFMLHLESVTQTEPNHSHWKAKAPLGQTVEWDAELTSDIANQRIGWKSLDGSDIANSGVVEFKPTKERGTEVKVTMTYESPGGKVGEWIAWLFGEEPSLQVADDLRRFKSLMETGLIMKVEGQPSGREPAAKAISAQA